MEIITPGTKEGKDDYWDIEDTMAQAERHLKAMYDLHDGRGEPVQVVDIYDNSTNHGGLPKNALVVRDKINKFCGYARKVPLEIKDGWFMSDAVKVDQSMRFKVGDIILDPIKNGKVVKFDGVKLQNAYPLNYRIIGNSDDSELIDVPKGAVQLLKERKVVYDCRGGCGKEDKRKELCEPRKQCLEAWNNDKNNDDKLFALLSLPDKEQCSYLVSSVTCCCALCTLQKQPDFAEQKSGLEEIYTNFNLKYHTYYICIFLPKFHPELNPIERIWGRMKWHIRRFSDGKLSTLIRLMKEGLAEGIMPLTMIRRFIRLSYAYLIGYERGLDVLQTQTWLKKQRKHRSYSEKIDAALSALYFPKPASVQPAWFTTLMLVSESEETATSNISTLVSSQQVEGSGDESIRSESGGDNEGSSSGNNNGGANGDIEQHLLTTTARSATTYQEQLQNQDESFPQDIGNSNSNDATRMMNELIAAAVAEFEGHPTSTEMEVDGNTDEDIVNSELANLLGEDMRLGRTSAELRNDASNNDREERDQFADPEKVAEEFLAACFSD